MLSEHFSQLLAYRASAGYLTEHDSLKTMIETIYAFADNGKVMDSAHKSQMSQI
jgi:hypothetical protein